MVDNKEDDMFTGSAEYRMKPMLLKKIFYIQ